MGKLKFPQSRDISINGHTDRVGILNYGYAEQSARKRMLDLLKAQDNTIIRLAALTETRDPETGRHLQRTQRYVRILAQELSKKPQYRRQLNAKTIDYL